MEKIEFINISFGGECNLYNYGIVRDCLQKKDFVFCAGEMYGILGEFGEGGVALSCGITGNIDCYEGKIYIDDIENNIKDIVDISWYVGEDLYGYKKSGIFCSRKKLSKHSVKEQIEQGILCKQGELDCPTIQRMFNISNERIGRNILYVSGERLKASAAIGYANGKKIFCFPWMNSKEIEIYSDQLTQIVNALVNAGCIVILPTTNAENVKKIFDKGHAIYL